MADQEFTVKTRSQSLIVRERPFGVLWPGDYDWYVDSVHGDDAYAGTSPTYPFKTIAALMAAGIGADEKIGLAKGSHWREQLDIAANNVQVIAYGNGDKPILDCSDVAPNASFAKTAGRTNVYEISVTPEWGTTDFLNVWEDGDFLVRVANLAACDATPGSYYPSGAAGTITLYVHASDSSSVIANGFVYEWSKRKYGATNGANTGLKMIDVRCQKNLDESGSVKLGRSSTLVDCQFYYGNKHNAYAGDGSVVTGCEFKYAYHNLAAVLLVFNENTPIGLGVTVADSTFEMPVYDAVYSGIISHINIGGSFGNASITGCEFTNVNGAVDMRDCTNILIQDCTFTGCRMGCRPMQATQIVTMDGCTFTGATGTLWQSNVAAATCTIADCSVSLTGAPTNGIVDVMHNNCVVVIEDCDFTATGFGAANGAMFINAALAGVSMTVNRTVNHINTGSNYRFLTAPTYVGDYNQFLRGGGQPRFNLGANTYTTLADWQTAVAPQDANSTVS